MYCRFTYFREDTSELVTAGRYAIKSLVRFMSITLSFQLFSAYATLYQVVGTHERENDTLFQLRGDIFAVCSFQHSFKILTSLHTSLRLSASTPTLHTSHRDLSTADASKAWTERTNPSPLSLSNTSKAAPSPTSSL